jgi:uncharacterized protein (DUF1499 family)
MTRRQALAALSALVLVPAPAMASLFGSLFAGSRPATLGAFNGTLASCPDKPNCVSSRATASRHAIAPLALDGPATEAWKHLVATIRAMPGATIVTDERVTGGRYLHAEFASRVLGFVDDLECLLADGAKAIEVRSASRLGSYDFGANRARVEALRAALDRTTR